MPTINIFTRSNNDKSNTYVLYCRLTYKKTKTEFSLKEKVSKENWCQTTQTYQGSKVKARYISSLIEKTIYSIKTTILFEECQTAKDVVETIRKTKKTLSIVEIMEFYILEERKIRKYGTIRNHNIKLENFKAFQKEKKKIYNSQSFNLTTAEKFKDWFQERANTTNVTTAHRHVQFLAKAMAFSARKGKIQDYPLLAYKGTKDKLKPTVYLTREELNRIIKHQYKEPHLLKTAHIFIFQCITGLSYSDIWSGWKIEENESGKIIKGYRSKNNQLFFVPAHFMVLELLRYYRYELPKIKNEPYNRNLKLIASICGINKRITSHTGRKTFATIKDEEGWTRETVSKMLGHRSIKTTEMYYLGESTKKIENEMKKRG